MFCSETITQKSIRYVGSKMWNGLPIELKSNPKICLNTFVKKINKSYNTNNKHGSVFVCSYFGTYYYVFKFTVAAAIRNFDARFEFLFVLLAF